MKRPVVLWAAAGLLAVVVLGLLAPRGQVWLRERRLRSTPRPVDVVLLTLDTTRADHLGCYGSRDAATPRLDALAKSGVRFLSAYSPVPLTCPAHASVLTGLIPRHHGVHDNGSFVLGESPTTLAEVFVDAGYRTGAFVSAFVLDRRFGLARGFATYEDDVLDGGRDNVEASVPSAVTVDRAIAWLRRDHERPLFIWVHFYDPHFPYAAPEPFASRYKDRPYDGEMAYMDAQVGRLLDAVAERRRPTLVAAIGDHGESLGEHGELTHSYFIYDATQHVPLLLALPGHLPAAETVAPVVRGIDLMPTLLELAGLPVPGRLDGQSLVPLITCRSRAEPGPAYMESYHPRLWWGAGELLGLRTGPWLFIQSKRPELYDTTLDPGELRNVASLHPAELARFRASVQGVVSEGEREGKGDPLAARQALDPDAEARLRALGYAAAGAPAASDKQDLPDAKDNAGLLSGHTRANQLLVAGQKEQALEVFRETLKLNPRSASIRMAIGSLLVDLGRPAEALPILAELSIEDGGNENAALGVARCLVLGGRKAEALKALHESLAHFPRSARLHEELGVLSLADNQLEAARSELQLALALAPRQIAARLRYGLVLGRLQRFPEAAAELAAVVAESPRSKESELASPELVALGSALLAAQNFEDSRKAYEAALAAGPQAEATYLNLALADYRSGRRAQALEVLRSGVAAYPRSADLGYRTARLLQEGGERPAAEAEYRRVLELDPKHRDAARALAELRAPADTGSRR
jgi:arylsulfatase A-like enzyme/tetratricopeptide (TPR) repeat protein